ncbi:putative Ig domain-containing protein [Curtobacterium sp. L1-20]|uniref:putative Ig domain-containing protein n=1 Tax=Curtobacterium sp. L1-20 TaxID=3138181 RepID=UPI003B5265A1
MTATSASAVEPDTSVSTLATPGDTSAANGSAANDSTTPGTGSSDPSSISDPSATTDPNAPSAPAAGTDPSAGDTSGSDAPAAGDPGAPTGDSTGTGTTPSDSTSPDAGTTAPPASTPTKTPATQTTPADQPTTSVRAAAQSVTIEGDASVGSDLVAKQAGFTSGSKVSYLWTDEDGTELSDTPAYTIAKDLAGKRVTVTVEGSVAGETATATTDTAVAPVFVDEDGQPLSDDDSDPYIEAKAGEAFSSTFRAFSTPAPTLSITWSDDEGNATTTAPAGVTFDAKTGVLSGTLTDAEQSYEFTVTATTTTPSGTVTSDQFGLISVEPGAPAGIEVTSADKGALLDGNIEHVWIIHPNGDVYTEDVLGDSPPVKGGKVTVAQGGTLLVAGSKVDRFGNEIYPDFDEDTDAPVFFTPTVTSDVASDVIQRDPDLGEVGVVSVTFPHASTHTLTVSGDSVPSTVFAVDVQPAAVPTVPAVAPAPPVAPAVVTTHTVGSGRLAYTGTDSTSALPWALGLVLAGVGLIGARTLRRRRAQR